MKKLFIAISAFAAAAVLTLTSFAAAPNQEQLDDLKNYGIFEGDADGSLRLEDTITRAEAAKIICSSMCMKETNTGVVPFPDIMSGNWAAGWISTAKSIGIVSGDENGNFRPDDCVTNEEYIKMLMSAIGYSPLADARGGFPAGYITVANTYSITEGMQFGVAEPALRGDIALMTIRALDVPMMFQTGFGSAAEYAVMDGKSGHEFKTLRKELDPDYVYPEEQKDNQDKNDDTTDMLDLTDSIYSYLDVEVSNLTVGGGTYRFNDKNRGESSPKYVVDSSTYVYVGDDTLPLSVLKDGMTVRILCTNADDGDISTVLGIELYENRNNSKILSQGN